MSFFFTFPYMFGWIKVNVVISNFLETLILILHEGNKKGSKFLSTITKIKEFTRIDVLNLDKDIFIRQGKAILFP